MPIIGTLGSSYYLPPVYALSQTFNTSGTYTVPANKTKVAVFIVSGGGGGGSEGGGGVGGAEGDKGGAPGGGRGGVTVWTVIELRSPCMSSLCVRLATTACEASCPA